MEVSSQLIFNYNLSPPLHRFRKTESRFLCSSSSLPLCGYEGFRIGRSPTRQTVLRSSNTFALGSISTRKKYDVVSNPKQGFGRPSYDHMHEQNKISRYTVGRSGLSGVGNPDPAFPSSEVQLGSNVRGICFYTVTAFSAIFLIVLMLAMHPFVLLLDRHRRKAHHFIAKIWATLTVIPFYKVTFEGLENLPSPDTPAVYVSNHQSYLDIYTLLILGRSFKFISKTAIFLIPVVGWAMYLMGTIPLKRMDSRSQLETLKRCINLIKKGASVFFFPEGTRSKDGKLGAFKKGAFTIAAKTRVPVVPITLIGTGKIMPAGMEGVVNSGSVKVVIHKPIEGSDAEVLCKEARNIIADVLNHES